jgi:glycerate kinase
LDKQTLFGKVVAGVCQSAKLYGVPTIALCGGKEISNQELDELGLLAAFSVVPGPCSNRKSDGTDFSTDKGTNDTNYAIDYIYRNKDEAKNE